MAFLLYYVNVIFRLTNNFFFQQRCHCEQEQRAKQSAKYRFDFSLFSAVFPAIIEFVAKMDRTTAKAWQIASLVALARNDSLVEK